MRFPPATTVKKFMNICVVLQTFWVLIHRWAGVWESFIPKFYRDPVWAFFQALRPLCTHCMIYLALDYSFFDRLELATVPCVRIVFIQPRRCLSRDGHATPGQTPASECVSPRQSACALGPLVIPVFIACVSLDTEAISSSSKGSTLSPAPIFIKGLNMSNGLSENAGLFILQ